MVLLSRQVDKQGKLSGTNYQAKYCKGGIPDVPYHVALELTPEQVKKLKILATSRDTNVKDFVSNLVTKEIEKENRKEENRK